MDSGGSVPCYCTPCPSEHGASLQNKNWGGGFWRGLKYVPRQLVGMSTTLTFVSSLDKNESQGKPPNMCPWKTEPHGPTKHVPSETWIVLPRRSVLYDERKNALYPAVSRTCHKGRASTDIDASSLPIVLGRCCVPPTLVIPILCSLRTLLLSRRI